MFTQTSLSLTLGAIISLFVVGWMVHVHNKPVLSLSFETFALSTSSATTTVIVVAPTSQTTVTRLAYVLTMDVNSDRAVHTSAILHNLGFTVEFVVATLIIAPDWVDHSSARPNDPERVDRYWSNKMAMLEIITRIANQSDPWGYIFEDDVAIIPNRTLVDIMYYERIGTLFFYLGICCNVPQFERRCAAVGEAPVRPLNDSVVELFCGLCAHARAFSREGARLYLDFNERLHKNNSVGDWIEMEFCFLNGGFPVAEHLISPSPRFRLQPHMPGVGHYGMFYQDPSFKSTLSN